MPTCTVNNKFKVSQNSNYYEKYKFERRYNYKPENREKDQVYEGEFFNDSIHGDGVYTWNNSGIYEGNFYSNCKEGYAVLSLPNNSYFEGLFIKNQPFGPGILTHGNGCQDVGFWVGQKLVRLSKSVDFIVPSLAPTSSAKKKLLKFRRSVPLNEKHFDSANEILEKCVYLFEYVRTPYSRVIYDSRSFFFNKLLFENAYFKNANNLLSNFKRKSKEPEKNQQNEDQYNSKFREGAMNLNRLPPAHCLCTDEIFLMDYSKKDVENIEDICLEESTLKEEKMGVLGSYSKRDDLKGAPGEVVNKKLADSNANIEECTNIDEKKCKVKEKPFPAGLLLQNRSELCTEMLKKIFRFRAFEEELSFNISKLMLGVHPALRRTGKKEKKCLQFLEICALGPPYLVKEFLCSNEISEHLMDARGNNGLMFAVAEDQHDIIDLLLDYGVDVNTFNDEGLTPLNLCLLRRLALTYKICSWETAFLPNETVETLSEDFSIKRRNSDQSFDYTFGDRTSANDGKTSDDVSLTKKFDKNNWKRQSIFTDEIKDLSTYSQITILNLKKELGIDSAKKKLNPEERSMITGHKGLIPKLEIDIPRKGSNISEFEPRIRTDKYLFGLSPAEDPTSQVNRKQKESLKPKKKNSTDSLTGEQEENDKDLTERLTEKIWEIDKTIEKLLQRGADPNVSDIPKPSIHLGVFTKDLKIVQTLLVYGASPDFQLPYNDGLLTPLHVVALLKPVPEYVDICQMLLKFGANPEEETSPEFSTYEGEKSLLDSSRGRTPLHLLCMRPDLEYGDPQGFLMKTGLVLAKASDKNNFYNGHSYLTLAMLCGNISLLRTFLESKYFNPNIILGKDLGTALHVLVSTLLQMRTEYEKSLKMCDLLIAAGADPFKKFRAPEHLKGTCIDYGYREIERERMKRKSETSRKLESKGSERKKNDEKDYLQDHVRVVEYLNKIVLHMIDSKIPHQGSENIKSRASKRNKYEDSDRKTPTQEQKGVYQNGKEKFGNKIFTSPERISKKQLKENSETKSKKSKDDKQTEQSVKKELKGNQHSETKPRKNKNDKQIEQGEKMEKRIFKLASTNGKNVDDLKQREGPEPSVKRKKNKEETASRNLTSNERNVLNKQKNNKEKKIIVNKLGNNEVNPSKKVKGKRFSDETTKGNRIKVSTKNFGEKKEAEKHFAVKIKERKNQLQKLPKKRDKSATNVNVNEGSKGRNLKYDYFDKEKRKRKMFIKTGNDGISSGKEKGKGKVELHHEIKKSNEKFRKSILTKPLTNVCSEMLPEKLRQFFLQMFGNCINFDINELFLPYVVLRDGDLYYRFQGKASHRKEQYSLI